MWAQAARNPLTWALALVMVVLVVRDTLRQDGEVEVSLTGVHVTSGGQRQLAECREMQETMAPQIAGLAQCCAGQAP